MNEVLNAIHERRSHRAYSSEKLTEEQISILLNAAVASPSAVNRQPWHFTMVENQEIIDRVHSAAIAEMMKLPEEKRSPRLRDSSFHMFYHAPAVLFISGLKDNHWTQVDCGIACQNVVLAAESIGLGSVILGMPRAAFAGNEADELRKLLKFPETHDFVIAIGLGIPTDTKPAHPVNEGKIDRI